MEDKPEVGQSPEGEQSLARADLLAAVSHEMRNTLNGLLGVSELLLASTLDGEQRQHVNAIRACADGLRNLSVDMLDLSRMESGRFRMNAAPFAPAEMLEHVVRMTGPQAATKCLHFEAHFGEGLRMPLLGDRQRISQILLNLVGNAIKFTSGGQIALAMTAKEHAGLTQLAVTVADTGCGMEPAMLETLFQPWRRRRLHAESGTGLGLAISRKLARQMHGDITVRSTPGIGSTFTLTLVLPISEEGAEPAGAIAPPLRPVQPASAVGLTVLVADDHHINRALLDAILRRMGHDVVLVDNGRSAVERALSGAVDMVLMDIQMPQLDGVSATREIRAHESADQHLPILGVTGHETAEHRKAFINAGMDGVVTKPFDVPALLSEMNRVIGMSGADDSLNAEPERQWDPDSPLADTLLMIRQLRHAAMAAGD